jgi:Tat protein translocase TatB subunit
MFGIGAGELFVIFIIAIVVIGPKQLPDVARTIGKTIAMFKRTTNNLRDQMHEEVRKFQEMDEIKEFKNVVESEMYNMKSMTEEHIQKELEAEEQRLNEETHNLDATISGELESAVTEHSEPFVSQANSLKEVVDSALDASVTPVASSTEPAAAAPGSNGSTPHTPADTAAHTVPADKSLS